MIPDAGEAFLRMIGLPPLATGYLVQQHQLVALVELQMLRTRIVLIRTTKQNATIIQSAGCVVRENRNIAYMKIV
jgi:hypothetical protein